MTVTMTVGISTLGGNCIAESEPRVAEIKSWFLCRHPTDQQACDGVIVIIIFYTPGIRSPGLKTKKS